MMNHRHTKVFVITFIILIVVCLVVLSFVYFTKATFIKDIQQISIKPDYKIDNSNDNVFPQVFANHSKSVLYLIAKSKSNASLSVLKYDINKRNLSDVLTLDDGKYDFIAVSENNNFIIFIDKANAKMVIYSIEQGKVVKRIDNMFSNLKDGHFEVNTVNIVGMRILITTKKIVDSNLKDYTNNLLVYDIGQGNFIPPLTSVSNPFPLNSVKEGDVLALNLVAYNGNPHSTILNPVLIRNRQVIGSVLYAKPCGICHNVILMNSLTSDTTYNISTVTIHPQQIFVVESIPSKNSSRLLAIDSKGIAIASIDNQSDILHFVSNPASAADLSSIISPKHFTFTIGDKFVVWKLTDNALDISVWDNKGNNIYNINETGTPSRPAIIGNYIVYGVDNVVNLFDVNSFQKREIWKAPSVYRVIGANYKDGNVYIVLEKSGKYYLHTQKMELNDLYGPIINNIIPEFVVSKSNNSVTTYYLNGFAYDFVTNINKVSVNDRIADIDENGYFKNVEVQISSNNKFSLVDIIAYASNSKKSVSTVPLSFLSVSGQNVDTSSNVTNANMSNSKTDIRNITFKDTKGNDIDLNSFSNERFLIFVGDPNCGSCIHTANDIANFIKEHNIHGIRVIVISLSNDVKTSQNVFGPFDGLNPIEVINPDSNVLKRMGVNFVPFAIISDKYFVIIYDGYVEDVGRIYSILSGFK